MNGIEYEKTIVESAGMAIARDLFCFCAFTSLRYSDVVEVRRFTTPYTITCYKNGTRHDTVFPKYALIGTHTGRKTFICFALSNGVPPDVVMKFTGHCDYKSMKPYIDITEDAKKDAIRKMEAAFRKK